MADTDTQQQDNANFDDLGAAFAKMIDAGFDPDAEGEEQSPPEQSEDIPAQEAAEEPAEEVKEPDEAENDAPDEPDEDQDDPDEDDEDIEDEGEDAPEAAEEMTVDFDGEKIPVSELKNGYIREGEYQAKVEEVASYQKENEAAREQLAEQQRQLATINQTMLGYLERIMPPEPSTELLDTDPTEFQRQSIQRRNVSQLFQEIQATNEQMLQQQTQEGTAAQQKYLEQNLKDLKLKRPNIRNKQDVEDFYNKLSDGAEEHYGIPTDEVRQIADHRGLLVLEDAIRYRKLQQKKPKTVKKVKRDVPVMKPANRNKGRVSSQMSNARRDIERAAKGNRIEDASGVLGALLLAKD
jgi:hypothetical protein